MFEKSAAPTVLFLYMKNKVIFMFLFASLIE